MAEAKTHLDIFDGQLTQVEAGTALPTAREERMYIVGNQTGLDDADIYYLTNNQVLAVHIGGTWQYIPFS